MFVTEKDEKNCFNAETNHFDQRMALGAPVRWLKYTTGIAAMSFLYNGLLPERDTFEKY